MWLFLVCAAVPTAHAQEMEQSADAAEAPQVSDPTPWRQGLGVGVRGEVDVLRLGPTTELIPAVSVSYTWQKLGGVATVLVQRAPGLRAEGQFHPITLGQVRPYARLGATAFFGEKDAQGAPTFLGSVSGRAALGVDMQLTPHLTVFADMAYEHFLTRNELYRPQSVLFSLGVALFP
ncbi:hypothetical protein ATI61_102177 [Archangium gephyra]|uniref:Outer membrane protein beta-barrel domain-containing protein n=1 Tax=Archangium gephyra TaxID=48 RepID=A0AAC8QDJ9_9BACT|nr:Hypothetical protein AA314_06732 [Archangium gephyra]REG35804.1 hypothetical protein ATI61_102177 [Archangium gephyra]